MYIGCIFGFYILYFLLIYFKRNILIAYSVITICGIIYISLDQNDLVPSENTQDEYVIFSRINEEQIEGSSNSRVNLIKTGFYLVREYPILGAGLANYLYYNEQQGDAHNDLMVVAATTGIVGLCIYLYMYFSYLFKVKKINAYIKDKRLIPLSILGLIFMFATGLTMHHYCWFTSMFFIFSLFLFVEISAKNDMNDYKGV